MAYEPLPIIEVELNNLLLDLDNYRIPTRSSDEASAMKFLFASEDALGAAKLILRNGYFDNEVPIVIPAETGSGPAQYVVVEGNRRVSALKALQNPEIIPNSRAALDALKKRYHVESENLPTKIRVLVAKDRASAAPHVARLHTGQSKRRWSLDQQANYYYSLLDSHTTAEDVKALYPGEKVTRLLKMAVIRKFLVAAPFKDPSLRSFASGDDLKMSVFEYAYRNKEIACLIGVTFGKDGLLLPATSTPEQIASNLSTRELAVLEHLVNGFRAKRLDTRSDELRKASAAYPLFIRELQAVFNGGTTPPKSQPGPPPPEQNPPSPPPVIPTPNPSPLPPRPQAPRNPRSANRLNFAGVPYQNLPAGLYDRYYELSRIDVSTTPVAAGILIRVVLESTIKHYYKLAGTPVNGKLREAFASVRSDHGKTNSIRIVISQMANGDIQKPGSINWLNLLAHSHEMTVNTEEVHQAWAQVSSLLTHLLNHAPADAR